MNSENLQEVIYKQPSLSEAVYTDNDLKELVIPKKINNPEQSCNKEKNKNILLGE